MKDEPTIKNSVEQVESAYSENIEQSDALLELTKDKSEKFQSELWRGLLAINGAGLAASATILSIDGFPSLFIKGSALLFFFGLLTGAYCWSVGLGSHFWSNHFAFTARERVEAGVEWARSPLIGLSERKIEKRKRHGQKLVRRIQRSTQSLKTLQFARRLVPSVGLCSSAFFAFGACILIAGVVMFQPPEPTAPVIRFVLGAD